jgi:glycosyltransferase involved in cell wall biosynthesis
VTARNAGKFDDILPKTSVKQELLSVILPAHNEVESLRRLLPELVATLPATKIIVVNEGSDDDTLAVCKELPVRVISHPHPKSHTETGGNVELRRATILFAFFV